MVGDDDKVGGEARGEVGKGNRKQLVVGGKAGTNTRGSTNFSPKQPQISSTVDKR